MSSEKTEEPTRRRQQKARRDGDLPVSPAVTQAAALLAVVLLIPAQAKALGAFSVARIRASVTSAGLEPTWVVDSARELLVLSAPLLLAAAVMALFVGFVQTQGVVAPQRMLPDLSRLNPVDGIKNLFNLDRTFQVLRAFLVVVIVSYLSVRLITSVAADLVRTTGSWSTGLVLAALISGRLLWISVLATLALAIVDGLVVRHSWLKRLRMSHDEIKREHREAEGDPQIKQERRRAHQEVLNSATIAAVKQATVVVINPTHYATALFYDEEETSAPRVVASGQDLLAKQIIDAARAYGVPVVRDVPVARALHELEVGEEIPEVLYEAVAEILRQVLSEQQVPSEPKREE